MLTDAEKQLAQDKTEQFMRDYLSLPWDKGCALIRSHVFLLEMTNAELRKELAESKALAQRLMDELSHQAEAAGTNHVQAPVQYGGDQ